MNGIRKGVIVASSLGLISGLAGCGSSFAQGPTTVTIWSWRSQDAGMWKKVQNALNKEGANIRIEFRAISPTSYDSVLQTAMDGGQGPDIFYGRAGIGTMDYAAAGMIRPLNRIVNFSEINPATLGAVTYRGQYYGVPLDVETMGIFYNKAMFKRYGLAVPHTWSQLIHICTVLKSHGITPIYSMGLQGWMLALDFDEIGATMMGNHFTRELVNRQATFQSAPYVNALSHYQALSKYMEPNFQAVGSADNEQQVALATGKAGMIFDGIFDVPTILQYNPHLQLGMFLVPPVNSHQHRRIDWYEDADLAMNSHITSSSVVKASKMILTYAATRAFGQDFSDIAGEISAVKGVQIPQKYPLSVEAYHWFQSRPINPIFDIRSAMDTPPVNAASVTSKTSKNPTLDKGIFTAESTYMLPLLEHKLTPKQAAKKIQRMVSWYFDQKK
ncbi:ABC transporter substrate-binding protein [Sulfobacillus thermosulfidooxidans]|uniref:ABC transporter substrate-binding protein n=1 Tax=Sulfobacillus thermosulfidooxidans TaxID=28034 RepID=UPI0009EBCCCA|nr:extracellular solute-binding protein [Sulfobacillus thermosulfidooxidans]